VDGFCDRDSVATVQAVIRELYRCVFEIQRKADLEDPIGPSKVTGTV